MQLFLGKIALHKSRILLKLTSIIIFIRSFQTETATVKEKKCTKKFLQRLTF